MQDLLKKIIEMDEQARKIEQQAKSEKLKSEEEVEALRRKIYDDYRLKTKMAGVHATTEAWKGDADLFKDMEATEFLGYTESECEAKVKRR